MKKLWLILVLLVLTVNLYSQSRELSEISKLKAENWKLKYQLVKSQCDSSIENLGSIQSTLEKEFRAELKAPDNSSFNWNTMKFEEKK